MNRVRTIFSDRLYVSAVGIIVVLIVCVSYMLAGVLDQPLTRRPDTVTVQLRGAGGLYEGSAVTYRGVKVGKVTQIKITDTGVDATVSLTSATKVPQGSRAVVRSLSPVGEQYLDFQPSADAGPYLRDGSVISAESTDIPKSLASTVVAINKVLRQINDRKLHSLLVELSTGLRGTGGSIGKLVDQGGQLLATLDELYPETNRLLHNGDIALDIATDHRADLEDLGHTAKSLAAFLEDYDPELRRTIQRTPGQVDQLARLVDDAERVLPGFLSKGVTISDIFATHDPHIAALLQAYPAGLGTLADHIHGGRLLLETIFDKDNRCDYSTRRRGPRDLGHTELRANPGCSASFTTLQRGAQFAPGPVSR